MRIRVLRFRRRICRTSASHRSQRNRRDWVGVPLSVLWMWTSGAPVAVVELGWIEFEEDKGEIFYLVMEVILQ